MSETVEEKAIGMGWSPKESFKGDPERWIDAQTYVERGESLLPIVKAQNRDLRSEVSNLRSEQSRLKAQIQESQDAIKALTEIHTEATMRAAKDRKKELVTAIETARKEGEVETVVALTEQLDEHQEAIAKAAKTPEKKPETKANGDMSSTPEWQAWIEANDWWQKDELKTDMAIAIAARLRRQPATAALAQKEFLEKVTETMESEFARLGGQSARQAASKVEGSRGSSETGTSGKTYADLPADVKLTCDKQSVRVTGPGKTFKDLAAFRKYYADMYHRSE
jgi:hypothetical protein